VPGARWQESAALLGLGVAPKTVSEFELSEMLGNSSLLLQRTTRRVTQLYDRVLGVAGLTADQFGLLANLAAMAYRGLDAPSIGQFAEQMGMDRRTLNRHLKQPGDSGLVTVAISQSNKRVRTVGITEAGVAKLSEALPSWREAQAELDEALGIEARLALNGLLALADERLTSEETAAPESVRAPRGGVDGGDR